MKRFFQPSVIMSLAFSVISFAFAFSSTVAFGQSVESLRLKSQQLNKD